MNERFYRRIKSEYPSFALTTVNSGLHRNTYIATALLPRVRVVLDLQRSMNIPPAAVAHEYLSARTGEKRENDANRHLERTTRERFGCSLQYLPTCVMVD